MSSKGFAELWLDTPAAGTALAASTAETSLLLGNGGEKKYLPAGYFYRKGHSHRLSLHGRISTVVTTPGTLTINLKFGSVIVWTSGAIPLNIVAKTNVPWELVIEELVARAIGDSTSANLIGIGRFQSEALIGSPASTAGGNGSLLVPVGAPTVGTGFDSTAPQLIDISAQWSVSNAANSITLETASAPIWS